MDILLLTNSEILDILWDMHILHNRIWDDRNVPIRVDTASLVLALSSLSAFSQKELDIVRSRAVDIHPADAHTLYLGHVEYLRPRERRPLLFFSRKYKQVEAHELMNAWSISSEGW